MTAPESVPAGETATGRVLSVVRKGFYGRMFSITCDGAEVPEPLRGQYMRYQDAADAISGWKAQQ